MTEWHPVTAKFTSEEKKILDTLHEVYGLNYNQSLKAGIELFARFLAMAEYYVITDSKIMKKINKIGKKHTRGLEADIKEILNAIPVEQQEAEYEKFSAGVTKIFSEFDNIFVKNRKRGRKKLPKKRGRPSIR